ncbi:hypothetical protein N5V81_13800 [Escherichia coli]|nr:hypothetical protein [Escherichia coli]
MKVKLLLRRGQKIAGVFNYRGIVINNRDHNAGNTDDVLESV